MPNRQPIQLLLEEALIEHCFSGYQLFLARGESSTQWFGGKSSYWPKADEIQPHTYFDIGSVTKVVVTTTLVALAIQRNLLSLEATLVESRPEFKGSKLEGLQVGDLLSHSAGLIAWAALPRDGMPSSAALIDWFLKHADSVIKAPPKRNAIYSDLGFWLLGLILERPFGSLAQAFETEVVAPLSLHRVKFGPVPESESAATEFSLTRDKLLHGEVFDDNAHALGGVAPHAGLFAPAQALEPWAREWLNAVLGKKTRVLEAKVAQTFVVPSHRTPATWGYGWDTKSPHGSTCGDLFSPRSFGHLGYPGCSVWVDPHREGIAILLTNRVHPSRYDERIRVLRPKLHDAIASYWDEA